MIRKPVAAVAVALVACLLSGCDGGSRRPDAVSSPTGGPSARTSSPAAPLPAPEPSADPVPPPSPPARDTPAGRRAFARHVVALWGFALRTNDAGPLLALSARDRPCRGCVPLRRELAQRSDEGWYVAFPGVEVRAMRLSTRGSRTVATLAVAIPESTAYNVDGGFRSTSPAHPRASFVVRMRLTPAGYRLLSFGVTG